MQSRFYVDCLEEALRIYGNPEVFNSDQGPQFTSEEFTVLPRRETIKISMDGRGRVFDNILVERFWKNVKCEDIYLNRYSTVEQLKVGLVRYFVDYNDIPRIRAWTTEPRKRSMNLVKVEGL
jgi:putative transposase